MKERNDFSPIEVLKVQSLMDKTEKIRENSVKQTTILDFFQLVIQGIMWCTNVSVVNGLPVCGISFRFGRKNEIRKEYLGTGF